MSTKQVLYIAFEAKRFAEAEPNVGKETIICVQRQDKTVSYVSHKGTLFLQKQYDEQNPSDRPGPEDLPDNCFRKPTDIS